MAGGRASRAPHGRRRGEQRAALSTVVGRSRPPEEPWRAEAAAQKGRKGRTPVEAGRERCEGGTVGQSVGQSSLRARARGLPVDDSPRPCAHASARPSVCLSIAIIMARNQLFALRIKTGRKNDGESEEMGRGNATGEDKSAIWRKAWHCYDFLTSYDLL